MDPKRWHSTPVDEANGLGYRVPSDLRWVEGMLAEGMAAAGIPGAAATVIRHGQVDSVICLGTTEGTGGLPVTRHTTMSVGPLSKTLAALGVLRLVEDGILGLDDLALDVLIDGPGRWTLEDPRMTIRHLLLHSVGRSAFQRRHPRMPLGRSPLPRSSALPASFRKNDPLWWQHAQWEREIVTIAEVISSATGTPFASFMAEQVLHPLGMFSTTFRLPHAPSLLPRSHIVRWQTSTRGTLAEAVSTPEDLGRLLAALVLSARGEESGLIGPETTRLMLSPTAPLPASGLAVWLTNVDGYLLARLGADGLAAGVCCFAPGETAGVSLVYQLRRGASDGTETPSQLAARMLSGLLRTRPVWRLPVTPAG